MGWFGPMGVGALFYYTIAIESFELDGPNAYARQVIEPIIYFIILSSVVVHGITIPVFFLGTFATRTITKIPSKSSDGSNEVSVIKVKPIYIELKHSYLLDKFAYIDTNVQRYHQQIVWYCTSYQHFG